MGGAGRGGRTHRGLGGRSGPGEESGRAHQRRRALLSGRGRVDRPLLHAQQQPWLQLHHHPPHRLPVHPEAGSQCGRPDDLGGHPEAPSVPADPFGRPLGAVGPPDPPRTHRGHRGLSGHGGRPGRRGRPPGGPARRDPLALALRPGRTVPRPVLPGGQHPGLSGSDDRDDHRHRRAPGGSLRDQTGLYHRPGGHRGTAPRPLPVAGPEEHPAHLSAPGGAGGGQPPDAHGRCPTGLAGRARPDQSVRGGPVQSLGLRPCPRLEEPGHHLGHRDLDPFGGAGVRPAERDPHPDARPRARDGRPVGLASSDTAGRDRRRGPHRRHCLRERHRAGEPDRGQLQRSVRVAAGPAGAGFLPRST